MSANVSQPHSPRSSSMNAWRLRALTVGSLAALMVAASGAPGGPVPLSPPAAAAEGDGINPGDLSQDEAMSVDSQPVAQLEPGEDPADSVSRLPQQVSELPSDQTDQIEAVEGEWTPVPGVPVEVRAEDGSAARADGATPEPDADTGVAGETVEPSGSPSALPSIQNSLSAPSGDASPAAPTAPDPPSTASPSAGVGEPSGSTASQAEDVSPASPSSAPAPPERGRAQVQVDVARFNKGRGTGKVSSRGFMVTFSRPGATQAGGPDPGQRAGEPGGFAGSLSPSGERAVGEAPEAPDGRTPVPLQVRIDYTAFQEAYGAGWADRMRVMAFPACYLRTPQRPECSTGVPIEFDNNQLQQRLVFSTVDDSVFDGQDIDTTAGDSVAAASNSSPAARRSDSLSRSSTVTARATGSAGVVYAAGGSGGNYGATPTSASLGWQVGPGSGEFTWSYPFTLPAASMGDTPGLSLNYSSAAVDGMTVAENGQADQAGTGWSLSTNFISRGYGSCSDDGFGTKGDLCWKTGPNGLIDDLTIVLNGQSSPLVRIAGRTDEFRLRQDPTWKVQLLSGTSQTANGDNNNEQFLVTDTDGTRYYFGSSSDSTLTVPVFGEDPNEPCYGSGTLAKDRWCNQGYRWMLQRTVDAHGNKTVYTYGKETNRYAIWGNTTATVAYDRAAMLKQIEYGFSRGTTPVAHQVVKIGFGDRCANELEGTSCDPTTQGPTQKPYLWPDVPTDLMCAAGETCTVGSPTFFSTKRYAKVETSTVAGNSSPTTTRIVDTWVLTHTLPDPDGSGTENPEKADLWLSGVQRTGTGDGGASETLPSLRFFGTDPLRNRITVPAGEPKFLKYRVAAIRNEAGGWVDVTYGHAENKACDATYVSGLNRWQSQKECFAQLYSPASSTTPTYEWFHKYVVTRVALGDNSLGYRYQDSASKPTDLGDLQVLDYEYLGNPAWRFNDDRTRDFEDRTWNDWRGYETTVIHTRNTNGNDYSVGTGDLSRQRITRFRGMNQSLANPNTGAQVSASIETNEINNPAEEQADKAWFQGLIAESEIKDPGGALITRTYTDYGNVATADDPNGLKARIVYPRFVRERTSNTATAAEGGAGGDFLRETSTRIDTGASSTDDETQSTDNLGLRVGTVISVETIARVANTAGNQYQRCTTTQWAANASAWMRRPTRTNTYVQGCGATTQSDASTRMLRRTRMYYDNSEDTGTPDDSALIRGDLTLTKNFLDPVAETWQGSHASYDTYGRPITTSTGLTQTTFVPDTVNPSAFDPNDPARDYATTRTVYNPGGAGDDLLTGLQVTSPGTDAIPAGLVTTTDLDKRTGQPVTITDPNNLKTALTYDPLGRLTGVRFPDRFAPTADGSLIRSMSFDYTNSVSSADRVHTETRFADGAAGKTDEYVFTDGWGRTIETQTYAPGNENNRRVVDVTGYDAQGLPAITAPMIANTGTIPLFDQPLNPAITTVGQWTRTTYDAAQRPVRTEDFSGTTALRATTSTYTGDTITTDPPAPEGTTRTLLDAAGNTARLELRDNTGTVLDATEYAYTQLGQLAALVKNYPDITAGQPAPSANDGAGIDQIWAWGYDMLGRTTTTRDPDTGTTRTTYQTQSTAEDRVTVETNDGRIETNYDDLGRPTSRWDRTPTDGPGGTGAPVDRLLAWWNYDTATNGKGLLSTANSVTTMPRSGTGSTTTGQGHLGMQNPGVFTRAVTAYDTHGNPTKTIDAYPATLTAQTADRATGTPSDGTTGSGTTLPGGLADGATATQVAVSTEYSWTEDNRLRSADYPAITTRSTTDATGSTIGVEGRLTATHVDYSYFDDGALAAITSPTGTANPNAADQVAILGSYYYNARGQLTGIATSTAGTPGADGRPVLNGPWAYTVTTPDGAYNRINRQFSYYVPDPANSATLFTPLVMDYTYDTADNPKSVTRTAITTTGAGAPSSPAGTTTSSSVSCYDYDTLNRLTTATQTSYPAALGTRTCGNPGTRTGATANPGADPATYNANDVLVDYNYAYSYVGDRPTAITSDTNTTTPTNSSNTNAASVEYTYPAATPGGDTTGTNRTDANPVNSVSQLDPTGQLANTPNAATISALLAAARTPVHQLTRASRNDSPSAADAALLPPTGAQTWTNSGRATSTLTKASGSGSTTSSTSQRGYDTQGQTVTLAYPDPTSGDATGQARSSDQYAYDHSGTRWARATTTSTGQRTTTIWLANGYELTANSKTTNPAAVLTNVRNDHTSPDGTALVSQPAAPTASADTATPTDNRTTWTVSDLRGSTRLTIKPAATGATPDLNYYDYTPYGDPTPSAGTPYKTATPPPIDPFATANGASINTPGSRGYLDQIHDPSRDLRLGARNYTPNTTLFPTPDPLLAPADPLSLNPYSYASLNPLAKADPSGLRPVPTTDNEPTPPKQPYYPTTSPGTSSSAGIGSGNVTWSTQGKVASSDSFGLGDILDLAVNRPIPMVFCGGDFSCSITSGPSAATIGKTTVDVAVGDFWRCGQGDAVSCGLALTFFAGPAAKGIAVTVRAAAKATRTIPRLTPLRRIAEDGVGAGRAGGGSDEAFHYTSTRWLEGIMSEGLRRGTYATPNGRLSPLQATLDLALPPNRALPDATVRIDLAGLRKAGYEIPAPSRVSGTVTGRGGRVYNMPGGGFEVQFPYEIPPQFLTVVPR